MKFCLYRLSLIKLTRPWNEWLWIQGRTNSLIISNWLNATTKFQQLQVATLNPSDNHGWVLSIIKLLLTVSISYGWIMFVPHNSFSIRIPSYLFPLTNFPRTVQGISSKPTKLNTQSPNALMNTEIHVLKYEIETREAPERAKSNCNCDIFFGSRIIHRQTLRVRLLRLASSWWGSWRCLTVKRCVWKLFGRRRGWRRGRILRAAKTKSSVLRSLLRRHCRR